MTWNPNEFRQLLAALGRTNADVYCHSVLWKAAAAGYHAEEYRRLNKALLEPGLTSKEWRITRFEAACHAHACIWTLSSIPDILAQMINALFSFGMAERDRNIKPEVLRELTALKGSGKMVKKVACLWKSREYEYIKDLANTVKHRKMVNVDWHIERGEATRNDYDIRFEAFNYGSRKYQITWVKDFVDKDMRTFLQQIAEVGEALNDHLRAQPPK